MKAILPKSWDRLPEREKKAIKEACEEIVNKTVDHEEAELQKVWLQLAVIVNYELFGHGKVRALRFLKQWKRVYRTIAKFNTNAERDEWLEKETAKIFGAGGYPHEWVDSLENGGKRSG